jgi:hypothetical protein
MPWPAVCSSVFKIPTLFNDMKSNSIAWTTVSLSACKSIYILLWECQKYLPDNHDLVPAFWILFILSHISKLRNVPGMDCPSALGFVIQTFPYDILFHISQITIPGIRCAARLVFLQKPVAHNNSLKHRIMICPSGCWLARPHSILFLTNFKMTCSPYLKNCFNNRICCGARSPVSLKTRFNYDYGQPVQLPCTF